MRAKKEKIAPVIKIRALNSFYMDLNDIGHLEYKSLGHEFQYQLEGSEEWLPFAIETRIVENPSLQSKNNDQNDL
jgi:hypothetical protein